MINSILMLGSTNKKMEKVRYVFAILWLGNMLIKANLRTSLFFIIANIVTFMIVFVLGKIIKGYYSNMIVSVLSILIWSIIIDIICFFMYPEFTRGQSLFSYIGNGILFNYKYVFTNILIVFVFYLGEKIFRKVKNIIIIQKVITSL